MLTSKHRRTLERVFERPTRPDIRWADVEALFLALGAEMTQGSGSRVRVALNGVRMTFHAPHPRPTIIRAAVEPIRRFLTEAGVRP